MGAVGIETASYKSKILQLRDLEQAMGARTVEVYHKSCQKLSQIEEFLLSHARSHKGQEPCRNFSFSPKGKE